MKTFFQKLKTTLGMIKFEHTLFALPLFATVGFRERPIRPVAIQDLTRVASQRRLGDHDTRLRVDVGGYRERRREALSRFATQIAEQVVSSGEARALEPMPSADRKVIHDVLTDNTAVVTRSEGEDPNRRVVIAPANA